MTIKRPSSIGSIGSTPWVAKWPAISGRLGYPRIFAVGDCNYSCVDEPGKKPDDWPIPPIPKISYPGEEMPLGWHLMARSALGGRWLKRL